MWIKTNKEIVMGRNKALSEKDKTFLLVTIYPEREKATSITLTTDISGGNLKKKILYSAHFDWNWDIDIILIYFNLSFKIYSHKTKIIYQFINENLKYFIHI